MGDAPDAATIKKTQAVLGKFVKKPALTEKLLKKPPFRFIFDVVCTVIRDSGYLAGLFTPAELKPEAYTDKESRVTYLQKVIDAVKISTGEAITVKPSKILSGHEADKTNKLLQAIGTALENKVNSDDAVAEVLSKGDAPPKKSVDSRRKKGIEGKPQGKPGQGVKASPTQKNKTGSQSNKSPGQNSKTSPSHNTDSSPGKRGNNNKATPPKDKVEVRANLRSASKEDLAIKKSASQKSGSGQKTMPMKPPPTVQIQDEDGHNQSNNAEEENEDRDSDNSVGFGSEIKSEINLGEDEPELPPIVLKSATRRPNTPRPKGNNSEEGEEEGGNDPLPATNQTSTVAPSSGSPYPPNSASEPRDITAELYEKAEKAGNPYNVMPLQTVRPPSARPAAPRIRKEIPVEAERQETVEAPVILYDGKGVDEEDDEEEEYVVQEAPLISVESQNKTSFSTEELDISSGKHGHLVEQILETKRQIEGNGQGEGSKVTIEWEEGAADRGRRQDMEAVKKDMDRLRDNIQSLTRNAHPLGKLMDFLQEDVDTMQKELQSWREGNREYHQLILQQQRLTHETIDPLLVMLSELEQAIEGELEGIKVSKVNIIKNEQRIINMMTNGKLRKVK